MKKLGKGDKIWIGKIDGANTAGWAVWNGKSFNAPCGLSYTRVELTYMLQKNFKDGFLFMFEQLIADGGIPRLKDEIKA